MLELMTRWGIVCAVVVMALSGLASGQSLWEQETLTNGFGGLADPLADKGVGVALSVTEIYQQKSHGGASGHEEHGRHSGSYDLEFGFDLERILGLSGATLYVHTEGSWPRDDLDTRAIGSYFGVNADAGDNRAMDVTEVWFEQAFADETLRVRLGKLDIGGGFECRGCPVSFDGSLFANDETAQFLNAALGNNPTIPMPDPGLAAVVYWNPCESWYASAGVADAMADARETGFSTAFGGPSEQFLIAETGLTPQFNSANGPLQGAYRVGIWHETGTDKEGYYVTCDQMLYKENSDEEDSQGLGMFARYGDAQESTYDMGSFWSVGCQYQGLLDGRDDDIVAVGYATGDFSQPMGFTEDEAVIEAYYNIVVAPWISITPSIQHIINPGSGSTLDNVTVASVRAQIAM
jgi:carbohydrate-selective porin OprB